MLDVDIMNKVEVIVEVSLIATEDFHGESSNLL